MPIPSVLLTALKEGFQYLGKKLDGVKSAVEQIAFPDNTEAINKQTATLASVLKRFEGLIEKTQNPKLSVSFDAKALKQEFKSLAAEMKGLASIYEAPDFKPLEKQLSAIYECMEKNNTTNESLAESFMSVADAIKAIKISSPDTVRLDKEQLGILSHSFGGSGIAPLNMATRVTTANVSMAASNTQYTYTFPSGTVSFTLKLRDQGTLLYYAWATGTLPSGDSSNYMTVPQNFLRSQEAEYGGKTIYLNAESNSQVAEIESFRR